ncbi:class I SAM-dependent methyltransferase [Pelagicoccus mobilis]|uniref:Class I SAM-dependent methyltransferase n=1 Tax=Pelagicoccus mobilis TaxID=415221 RepID=A0A934RX94_9BACT|nr:class I SAM-dependent methyltransferase [Pelagicoccus mobilis]MBK1878231.1 class I SAM-dependent methyltransferase [Pelagicoccus mobilis]
MPKPILIHSAIYQLLRTARDLRPNKASSNNWNAFLNQLSFNPNSKSALEIEYNDETIASLDLTDKNLKLYKRGDTAARAQETQALTQQKDNNQRFFQEAAQTLANFYEKNATAIENQMGTGKDDEEKSLLERESDFHDAWAADASSTKIDVIKQHQVCTAPEIKYILEQVGDLKGKNVLEIGCGLGETSVYMALQGANVYASDLSPGMLKHAEKLAEEYNVKIHTLCGDAGQLAQLTDTRFDFVYAANILHHADIIAVIEQVKQLMKPGAVFASWDPVAYNPAINAYRKMAMEVRTEDEHPLTRSDINWVKSRFEHSNSRYYWLSTLSIFLLFYFWKRKDPNKERYWKVVLEESEQWAPIYKPLKRLDDVLLKLIPPLRLLCWNVVLVCRNPID